MCACGSRCHLAKVLVIMELNNRGIESQGPGGGGWLPGLVGEVGCQAWWGRLAAVNHRLDNTGSDVNVKVGWQ